MVAQLSLQTCKHHQLALDFSLRFVMLCNFISSMILQVPCNLPLMIINVFFWFLQVRVQHWAFQDWFPSGETRRVRLGDSASSVRQLAEEMLKREVEEAQKG